MIDVGLATLVLAFVPLIIATGGFWLRERYLRRQLAASLLQEVRLKVDNLMHSVSWGRIAKTMLEKGTNPRILIEGGHDFIFDENRARLLTLPTFVLKRVVKFYHLDDFHNIAMNEFRDPEFLKISVERRLTHMRNTEEDLLFRAIRSGIFAERALSLVSGLNMVQELNYGARAACTLRMHHAVSAKANRNARARLKRLRDLDRIHRETWAQGDQ